MYVKPNLCVYLVLCDVHCNNIIMFYQLSIIIDASKPNELDNKANSILAWIKEYSNEFGHS